jgi:rhamnogalacturonyl hydrolase YesR
VPDALHGRFPEAGPLTASDGLAFQLGAVPAAGVGTIPAIEVIVPADVELMPPLLEALARGGPLSASPARVEMRRRITRSPKDIAELLAGVYGHDVTDLVYTQTMPLIGRVRTGATSDVERLLEPWTLGGKPPLPERPTSSHFSGHLVFSELHRATGDPRYRDVMRDVANLAFDQQGAPREAMPLHNEMSDAFFMGSPILAAAGRATGDAKYFAMALRNARFIGNLTRRPDGLHRHSPLDDTAWGRGNGFAAFGLALAIDEMPDGTAERAEMIATLSSHLSALLPFQDETGMWHQVIDHPESYREFSVTALLAYVMQRGVAIGWLDRRQVGPAIDRAWYAIRSRIGSDGGLVDVCTSTGKMTSLREYLDRPAVLGIDARGGGMALVLAAELAGLHDAAAKR